MSKYLPGGRQTLLAAAIGLCAVQAQALPFSPIDARSLSMGGVGVASARASSAGLFNPALLAAQASDADFSIVLPSVGVVLDDRDNVIDIVDEIQNGSLAKAEDAIERSNNNPDPQAVRDVGVAARALAADLPRMGSKPVNLEMGGGIGLGVPSRKVGVGFHVNGAVSAGVMATVSRNDMTVLNTLADYTEDNGGGSFADNCAADDAPGGLDILDSTCQVRPLDKLMKSSLTVVGVMISEVGLSLAHELSFGEEKLAIGITPKVVKVDTIHYRQTINSNEGTEDIIDDARYRKEYEDVNLDVGVAKTFGGEGSRLVVGGVIKNLISRSYETAPDDTGRTYDVSLEPQVRAGVSKFWGGFSVAADVDLTKNQSAGLGEDSQFLGLGMEADGRYAQFRLGYRHNLVSDGIQDMATIGFGLGPLALTALYADEHSMGVNVQLGLSF